jgi:hypothetical protein
MEVGELPESQQWQIFPHFGVGVEKGELLETVLTRNTI